MEHTACSHEQHNLTEPSPKLRSQYSSLNICSIPIPCASDLSAQSHLEVHLADEVWQCSEVRCVQVGQQYGVYAGEGSQQGGQQRCVEVIVPAAVEQEGETADREQGCEGNTLISPVEGREGYVAAHCRAAGATAGMESVSDKRHGLSDSLGDALIAVMSPYGAGPMHPSS